LFVTADVAAELKDWDRVAALLEAGAWGAMPKDVVRMAMSARMTRERGNTTLQRQLWDEALRIAGSSMPALRGLQRLAAVWQWDDEVERSPWVIARTYPDQTWAHQTLFSVYRARKNTAMMRDVLAALRDSDPSVARFQSDWAIVSLLVESTPAWNQPKELLK